MLKLACSLSRHSSGKIVIVKERTILAGLVPDQKLRENEDTTLSNFKILYHQKS